MSVALAPPPSRIRIHRAPVLDPPFDDELRPSTYRPTLIEPAEAVPPQAIAGASPECHSAALRFLNVCLELFNGFRAPAQLRPLLHIDQATDVLDELARALAARAPRRREKVRRRQIRTCEPRDGVAEVAAVLCDDSLAWAMAYRLERGATGWRCTALAVLL